MLANLQWDGDRVPHCHPHVLRVAQQDTKPHRVMVPIPGSDSDSYEHAKLYELSEPQRVSIHKPISDTSPVGQPVKLPEQLT